MSSPDGRAIGVLGSAFNPPHLGHLALAQEAAWQLGLEQVILVPTGDAPHKRIADDPGRAERMDEDQVDRPKSRTDIADHLGLTIETVSRSLTQLERGGVIELPAHRRTILLRNKAALRHLDA